MEQCPGRGGSVMARPRNEETKKAVGELTRQGVKRDQIAMILEISPSQVTYYRKQLGLAKSRIATKKKTTEQVLDPSHDPVNRLLMRAW